MLSLAFTIVTSLIEAVVQIVVFFVKLLRLWTVIITAGLNYLIIFLTEKYQIFGFYAKYMNTERGWIAVVILGLIGSAYLTLQAIIGAFLDDQTYRISDTVKKIGPWVKKKKYEHKYGQYYYN